MSKQSGLSLPAKLRNAKALPIPDAIKRQSPKLAQIPDDEIDMTDMPERLDWSNAVVGKDYRPIKEPVSLRLDADVLSWFRGGGKGYQSKMANGRKKLAPHIIRGCGALPDFKPPYNK